MSEPQYSRWSPARLNTSSSPLLATYLVALVIGIWLLIHVVFQLRLTQLLSHAIAATGAEWIMYLLIGLSVLSVGVTIERWLFYRKHAVEAEPLKRQLQELLRNQQADDALSLAQSLPAMEAGCRGLSPMLEPGPRRHAT
jgi:hypothetical protein